MNIPDDSIAGYLLAGAAAVFTALSSLVWQGQKAEIKNIKDQAKADLDQVKLDLAKSEKKLIDQQVASNDEINRQRDNITKVFDLITAMDHRTNERLTEMSNRSEGRHIEILNMIHQGLSTKVDK